MDNSPLPPEEAKDIRFQAPTFIDPLTGLLNQYYLHQFLPEELEKAKLNNYPLTIFMMDLDSFKAINDTYGHLSGDAVLKQLAGILKKFGRQTDMVIRYAGDEFAMLLPTADQARAQILADRLIDEMAKSVFIVAENQQINLGISIGFATYPDDAKEVAALVDLADKALYLSKKKGKNRVSQAKEVTVEAASYLVAMNSFPCPKFIDRDNEINRLKQILDEIVVKSNLSQTAFISAAAGIGKSRLLNELNNYVRDHGLLLSCRGSSVRNQDAYYFFIESISAYIEKAGIDSIQMRAVFSQLPFEELAELGRFIPAIAGLLKGAGGHAQNDKSARFLLFKSFLDFLVELNKAGPVVISFDDIHCADKASLELIRYLSKQEKNKRIFIVCTFLEDKSKDADKESDFSKLWEEIRYDDNFTHIPLSNFSQQDTISMIKAIFPGLEAGKDFYELVYGTTHGNSSFIEEMLKGLVENAVIFYQDDRWQIKQDFSVKDVPVSLEEVITKRLKNLDEETKEMIVQAAVIGEDFSVDALKKINNKDEGFMLELLSRAKKMRLVDELDSKGKFGFISPSIQNLLYNELSPEQRSQLHSKIGQNLAQSNKDNLSQVASQLAYHFSKTPKVDEADKYAHMVTQKLSEVFDPSEIIEYLDKLTQEVISEEERLAPSARPLSEKMLQEALKLVRYLQGVVKNFQLYPPGAIRINSVKEAVAIIGIIHKESDFLNLSEVEKSLVINGRRISPKEMQQANVENFLAIMVEQSIKTISFDKKITEDELNRFIGYFSQPAGNVIERGGWTQVAAQEAMKGIKIEEVHYLKSTDSKEFSGKKKIEDIMLMEFLLGKVDNAGIDKKAFFGTLNSEPKRFAQTIMNAAEEAVKEGRAVDSAEAAINSVNKIAGQIIEGQPQSPAGYAKDLARVISELKPALKNKIIRSQMLAKETKRRQIAESLIADTPDEVVMDMIVEEYKDTQQNLVVFKDFIDKVPVDVERKKTIMAKLDKELIKENVDDKDIDYFNGKLKWEELSMDKRMNTIMRLPDEYYKLEASKIKMLLEELDRKQDKGGLENIFHHLLSKANQVDPEAGKNINRMVGEFVKTSFNDEKTDAQNPISRIDVLLKRLSIELDPKIFSSILEIFAEVIRDFAVKARSVKNVMLELEKPATKKNYLFIQQFLAVLSRRLESDKERSSEIYKITSDFISSLSSSEFLEILVYSVIASPYQKTSGLKAVFALLGDKTVDALISLGNRSMTGWSDSFREYIIRRRIADLFYELGDPALNILREKIAQSKTEVSVPLVELIGYLKKEDWVDLLIPLINHKEFSIRCAVIRTLGNIAGDKSIDLLSRIIDEEKDKNALALAKRQLKKLKG